MSATREWNVGGVKMQMPADLTEFSKVPEEFAVRLRKRLTESQCPPEWLRATLAGAEVQRASELSLGEFMRLAVGVARRYWFSGNTLDLNADTEIVDYNPDDREVE